MQIIKLAIFIGIASGTLLGLLMKLVEEMAGILVYTLLLNIDFIPFLSRFRFTEPVEFLFHLLVSIAISYLFIQFAKRMGSGASISRLMAASIVLCLPTIGFYFILGTLAIKKVPAWNDWGAFLYWLLSHTVYACSLPFLYRFATKKRSTSLR